MSRLGFIPPENASPSARQIFKKIVLVPNILCIMANSDVVLDAFAQLNANLENHKLSQKYRKIISLAVSQFNNCPYCIALHTQTAAEAALLTPQECLDARRMASPDPRANAMLKLTQEILEKRGHVEDATIEKVKQHGFDDQDIVEAIATLSFITMANYTANVAQPELDFPEPPPLV
jgi:uncharacterized peroxidase-related enzyme